MTIGWPQAVIAGIAIMSAVGLHSARISSRTEIAREEVRGKHAEEYRQVLAGYESLAAEMRELQKAMRQDLADIRRRVESIERMMRDVG